MRKEEKTAVCQYAQIIASSIQVMYSINVRRVEEVLIHHGCCRGRVAKTTPRWSSVIQLKNANTCRLNYIHESLLNWLKDSVQVLASIRHWIADIRRQCLFIRLLFTADQFHATTYFDIHRFLQTSNGDNSNKSPYNTDSSVSTSFDY